MYAIYHRPPHELSRLCVLKKSKLASLRYASEGALAVSYTHLDVYKRQGQYIQADLFKQKYIDKFINS